MFNNNERLPVYVLNCNIFHSLEYPNKIPPCPQTAAASALYWQNGHCGLGLFCVPITIDTDSLVILLSSPWYFRPRLPYCYKQAVVLNTNHFIVSSLANIKLHWEKILLRDHISMNFRFSNSSITYKLSSYQVYGMQQTKGSIQFSIYEENCTCLHKNVSSIFFFPLMTL